jgi:hypothetical protein
MQESACFGRCVVGSWDRFQVKRRGNVGAPSDALRALAVEAAVGRSAVGERRKARNVVASVERNIGFKIRFS